MDAVDQKLAAAQEATRRAEAVKRMRDEAPAKLAEVRELGAKLKAKHTALHQKVLQAIANESLTEKNVTAANTLLNDHGRKYPDDLPSKKEIAAWEAKDAQLREQLKQCCATKGEARQMAAQLRYEFQQATEQLQNLRFRESNLQRVANGDDLTQAPDWARGGVSAFPH
jgi:hypothetical protein